MACQNPAIVGKHTSLFLRRDQILNLFSIHSEAVFGRDPTCRVYIYMFTPYAYTSICISLEHRTGVLNEWQPGCPFSPPWSYWHLLGGAGIYVYRMFFFIDLYIHSLNKNSKWARHVDQDVRSSEEGHGGYKPRKSMWAMKKTLVG